MPKTKTCVRCKRKIAVSEYEWHLQNGHDVGGILDQPLVDDDEALDDFNDIDFLQPNLDASKDIGYPCREGGAYGSYSSIDGFDDESNA